MIWRLGLLVLLLTSSLLAAGDSSIVRARQQFDLDHFSGAIHTLQGAARSLPDNASIYYWLGRCYFELQNYQEAISEGQRAVKLALNDSEYLLWLARGYDRRAEKGHSFWMAIRSRDTLEDARRADPRNGAATITPSDPRLLYYRV
jgi:tetratricopeptide (TPR) repeat protein